MKKNSAVTAQTKQNLLDAFWDLYCTTRIEKITIKEITKRAGYNRSTFYEYFTDVYDVLEQLENSLIAKLQELPIQQLSAPGDPFQLQALVNMYSQHSRYLMVLLGDHGDPAFQGKIKASMKPMIKEILVARGAKDGFELDYTLEYALSAMIGILSYWFNQENGPTIEKLMELLAELSSEGVMRKLM
ncbi:TetR/AcrR family transcriptional regulator [Anaerobacillus alkaliphilus]|uniref:TetR/AcrR family transcriptional regulator n=1 Tax=Anaerobacillus alkaliphilus TaxID=1548597 RepID=A0A4Q0VNI2_9BACI|nr:TetR/AcrR family transcriptional regulator [Anaerobacillus alkaliphilus]RXI96634.1 TetR/AcrR family transcriptional regulator [Anaerobacillus alkaliphilus]